MTRKCRKKAMYYAKINPTDIANGPGCRVSIFVSGCTHQCPGCFDEIAWNFQYGDPYTDKTESQILAALDKNYIQGLSILGGEPFEPNNQETVYSLICAVRKHLPQKDIWCYSGSTMEELLYPDNRFHTEWTMPILKNIDVLVDGKFDLSKKNIRLQFRGSANQRVIDIKKTLQAGSVITLY